MDRSLAPAALGAWQKGPQPLSRAERFVTKPLAATSHSDTSSGAKGTKVEQRSTFAFEEMSLERRSLLVYGFIYNDVYMYIYICVYIYMYIYMYIYISVKTIYISNIISVKCCDTSPPPAS